MVNTNHDHQDNCYYVRNFRFSHIIPCFRETYTGIFAVLDARESFTLNM